MTPESLAISNAVNGIIFSLRKIRDNLIFQLQFKSAVFLSDKILALKPSTEDYAVLAKCLYRLKEYQRAAYIITCRNLHHTDISCCLLVIKCYYDKPDELEVYSPFDLYSNHSEFLVALAERHYYNCKYSEALEITTNLLKQDQYNNEGLLVHASTLMEFKNTNDLFELAQKLIDLYPEREISWYVLGCYYHLIEKVDLARRFLLKSTTLNCFFAPAWLLYGHSFSQESEHDQAISAFFKAAHFMPGCHLPLLYIGVEYILTDNCRLGEKFIMKALTIAPKDPLTLHELGIIAFNTNEVIRAERHFKAALSILKYNQNPTALPNRYDTLLNNMGHVKRKINRPLEAIEFHKNALIMSPQSAPSYTAIGFIYCQLSKWKEAVDYLDMAYGLNKLQRNEDPHTKTLLENHALKNYQRNCRDSLGFELNQFDCSYTNAKRL
ncbi:PREDICTED: cell division cycle protein 16 homolog, partial [Rhagoletis zephyria]|uniref:cell division cycle protein 16 homolog n=1 Tax=Rhagoletis zephyria TaxID=28612 RepID=UPI00081136F0